MKTTIVIPTYWRGPQSEQQFNGVESDLVFDATPLDEEGTLALALDSVSLLDNKHDIAVAVIAVPTSRELKQAVQLKVESIVALFEYDFPVFLIGPDTLAMWRHRLKDTGHDGFGDFMSCDSCADVHNLCLLAGMLTGSEAVAFLYDDEVYDDPGYLNKALEFIGTDFGGELVTGITGYSPASVEESLSAEVGRNWRRHWADDQAMMGGPDAGSGLPRLSMAPFAFGGNMVIHRDLYEKVPFDPQVPSGVSSDYLMNARIMGYNFLLDRQLRVKRMPRKSFMPDWYRLRKEIIRFSLGRAKLHFQPDGSRRHLTAKDLDPYPGRFLRDDLHDLAMRASLELASDYLLKGRDKDAEECMVNIAISRAGSIYSLNRYEEYVAFQRRWQEFTGAVPKLKIWLENSAVD